MINKKASEYITTIMFFVILAIILFGILFILGGYTGDSIDIRGSEARILHDNIMNCIIHLGFLDAEVLDGDFNLYSKCRLSEDIIYNNRFYFNISFIDNNTNDKIRNDIYAKDKGDIVVDCDVNRENKYPNFPYCYYINETYFYINKSGDVGVVRVVSLTASDDNEN